MLSLDFRRHLTDRAAQLEDGVARAVDPHGGFGWLGDDGRLVAGQPTLTYITCRMTHVAALATLRGNAGSADLVDHGVQALRTVLHDDRHGGWLSARGADGGAKEAYTHAFVVLAAASATAVEHPDGADLLEEALGVVVSRFWNDTEGLVGDQWDASWSQLDSYRGANANMHTVEAFLAAADVTGQSVWADRARRIVDRMVNHFARQNDWRLPEHHDEKWVALCDYNIDDPEHQFRPYGVTIGHLLEWSRLTLNVRASSSGSAPAWMLPAAVDLYEAGVGHGWNVDGAEGFVYTTDFEDRPVVRERLHWVVAEAIAAAWTLFKATGEERYLDDYRRWWSYAETYLVDEADGSWRHELDPNNRPSAKVWSGRPDVYHAYQATVLPLMPDRASVVGAGILCR